MLFTPVSGDTIKSITVEAALAEVAGRMVLAENAAIATDPNTVSRVSVGFDNVSSQIVVTGSNIPLDRVSVPTGGTGFEGLDYVPFAGYVGASTDIVANSLGGALFALVNKIEQGEQAQPTVIGRLNSTINNSNNSYSFNIALDGSYSVSASGDHAFGVSSYLV
jgi:hypothetical protein